MKDNGQLLSSSSCPVEVGKVTPPCGEVIQCSLELCWIVCQ